MENCHITEELNNQELKKIRDTFYAYYNTIQQNQRKKYICMPGFKTFFNICL